jgi:hypothetical protein
MQAMFMSIRVGAPFDESFIIQLALGTLYDAPPDMSAWPVSPEVRNMPASMRGTG